MTKPMMKCGHTANGVTPNGMPCCVICAPRQEAFERANKPYINNREAKCKICGRITKSDMSLAFFKYKPDNEFDEWYCGCCGYN